MRTDLAAVRIRSRLLGRELWLARDVETARALVAEGSALPVLTFADVPALRGKSGPMLGALLEGLAAFPGARVLQ